MDLLSHELMYEFHAKDLAQTKAIKKYADHAVQEIETTYGWDADVQINIWPEVKDRGLFAVSMIVYGIGEPIVVRKDGKHVIAVL